MDDDDDDDVDVDVDDVNENDDEVLSMLLLLNADELLAANLTKKEKNVRYHVLWLKLVLKLFHLALNKPMLQHKVNRLNLHWEWIWENESFRLSLQEVSLTELQPTSWSTNRRHSEALEYIARQL